MKLKYDKLLSSFAFDFNLRRYSEEGTELLQRLMEADGTEAEPLPMFTSCCPGWAWQESACHVNLHILRVYPRFVG